MSCSAADPTPPQPDRILCIVDAANLERNLYLVHQILDLGRPVILVVNMMDVAAKAGLEVRVDRLERELGIPVIPCEAVNGRGVIDLKLAMSRADLPLSRHAWDIPPHRLPPPSRNCRRPSPRTTASRPSLRARRRCSSSPIRTLCASPVPRRSVPARPNYCAAGNSVGKARAPTGPAASSTPATRSSAGSRPPP
jgi:hypothetical protein